LWCRLEKKIEKKKTRRLRRRRKGKKNRIQGGEVGGEGTRKCANGGKEGKKISEQGRKKKGKRDGGLWFRKKRKSWPSVSGLGTGGGSEEEEEESRKGEGNLPWG